MTRHQRPGTITRLLSVACALCLATALSACSLQGGTQPLRGIVKIGLVAPFSGAQYATGYNALFGAKLALREWNARGGAAGYRVEMVALDEGGGAEAGGLQGRKLVLDSDVLGVIGHLDEASATSAAEEYRRGGMSLIALSPGDYASFPGGVFRLVAGPDAVAEAVADLAISELGAREAAVLTSPASSARDLGRRLAIVLGRRGLSIIHQAELPSGPAGRRDLAHRLRQREPSLLVLVGQGVEVGTIVADLRQAGVRSLVLAGPTEGSGLLATARPEAEGVYYFSLAAHPRDLPGAEGFVRDYRALGGLEPGGIAALTYDATNLLLEAMARASRDGRPDRRQVAVELARSSQPSGLSGPLDLGQGADGPGVGVHFYRLIGPEAPGTLIATWPHRQIQPP